MHQAAVSKPLQVLIADVEAAFCVLPANQHPQAVLRVPVDDFQAVRPGNHRKEPVFPAQLVVPGALQQLAVEDADERGGRLLPLHTVSLPPAKQRPRLAPHLCLDLAHGHRRYVHLASPAEEAQKHPALLRGIKHLLLRVDDKAPLREEAPQLRGQLLRLLPVFRKQDHIVGIPCIGDAHLRKIPVHLPQVQIRVKGRERRARHDPLLLPDRAPLPQHERLRQQPGQECIQPLIFQGGLPEQRQQEADRDAVEIIVYIRFVRPHAALPRAGAEGCDRILCGAPRAERIERRGKQAVVPAQEQPGEQLEHRVLRLRVRVHRALFLRARLADHGLCRQREGLPLLYGPADRQISLLVDEGAQRLRKSLRAGEGRFVIVKALPAGAQGERIKQRHTYATSSQKKKNRGRNR